MKKVLAGLLGIMLAATFMPGAASAADDWKFSVTPYLWAAGMDTTMDVKGHKTEMDMSFGDIFDNLDFAVMLNMEARKGRFGAYTDVTYVALENSASLEDPASGAPLLDVKTSIDQWVVDLGASWAVAQWGAGEAGKKGSVELGLGGRYWSLSTQIKAKSPLFDGAAKIKEDKDWIDPFVGVTLRADLTPKLALIARGDVGGFDLGGSISKMAWSASAYLGWHFNPRVSAWAGWKHLSVERESDSGETTVDLDMDGPLLGVAFTF